MAPTKSKPVNNGIDLSAIEAELRPLSTENLRGIYVECHGKAAEFMARAAMCVKLMEERGDDVKGFPVVYRRIACGQVLPELAWKFIESPMQVRAIVERLPIPDQKRLAASPVLPVVEPDAGGGFTHRMTHLPQAPAEIVKQVIGPEGVRSPEEQIAYLATQKAKASIAAKAKSKVQEERLDCSVTVRLTKSEWDALTINAIRNGVKPAQLARQGLQRSGVLKEGR